MIDAPGVAHLRVSDPDGAVGEPLEFDFGSDGSRRVRRAVPTASSAGQIDAALDIAFNGLRQSGAAGDGV